MVANSMSALRLFHAKFCYFQNFFCSDFANALPPKLGGFFCAFTGWQDIFLQNLSKFAFENGKIKPIKQKPNCEKINSIIFFQGYCQIVLKKFALFDIIHLTVYFAY